MPQVYQYKLTVPDTAEDVNGHVNNIEYLRWMQDAAVLHSDIQGCTKATIDAGATWVVRTHHVEYLRPAFAGEHIAVLTWVTNFRRVQSLRKYRIIRIDDNTVLVEGKTNWVFVDAKTGNLRSIPPNVIAAFELLPEEKEADVVSLVKISHNLSAD
jgi:acyl-CoA thioester hydrolase